MSVLPVKNESVVLDAIIANGASLSGAVALEGIFLAKIAIPAEFDGTVLTFQGSLDGSTFYNLYTSTGTELSYTVAASRIVTPNIGDFYGLQAIKLRAGSAGTPTNQTGDTVIKLNMLGR